MKYAMLYNIFVCWVVAGMGILTARAILTGEEKNRAITAFGYFWLFSAGLWLCSGLRHLFFFFHYHQFDIVLFYFVQIFLGIHLMTAGIFLTFNAFQRKRLIQAILIVLGLSTAGFLLFFFIDGIIQTKTTHWATEHLLSDRAMNFFLPAYAYCIIMTIVAMIRTIISAVVKGKLNRKDFFALFALFLYEAAGIFDVQGGVADYRLMIIRGIYMVAALISFLSFAWDSSSIRIVRAEKEEAT